MGREVIGNMVAVDEDFDAVVAIGSTRVAFFGVDELIAGPKPAFKNKLPV